MVVWVWVYVKKESGLEIRWCEEIGSEFSFGGNYGVWVCIFCVWSTGR
jgi:hypothetical protein